MANSGRREFGDGADLSSVYGPEREIVRSSQLNDIRNAKLGRDAAPLTWRRAQRRLRLIKNMFSIFSRSKRTSSTTTTSSSAPEPTRQRDSALAADLKAKIRQHKERAEAEARGKDLSRFTRS